VPAGASAGKLTTANAVDGRASQPLPTWHTHTHKNHYTTGSVRSNTATHTTMAITDSFINVCGSRNASILGGIWPSLLEAFPPRLPPVMMLLYRTSLLTITCMSLAPMSLVALPQCLCPQRLHLPTAPTRIHGLVCT
jgi:hypothetical protein